MTSVKFLTDGTGITGFCITGHSSENCNDDEGRIVCSAISSAAYMTANTITEIIGDRAQIDVDDAFMSVEVKNPGPSTREVLKGFKLHIEQLAVQYSNRIKVNSEV